MRRLFVLPFVLFLAVPVYAQPALTRIEPSDAEVRKSLRVDWYGVYLAEKKVGYYHESRSLAADGSLLSKVDFHMKLVSMDQKVDIKAKQTLTFDGKAPYALRRVDYSEDAGPLGSEFVMTRNAAGKFDVVQTVGKNVRKREAPALDFTFADVVTLELWLRRGPAKGAEVSVRDLDPKEAKIDWVRSRVLGEKTSLVEGVAVKFFELESESSREMVSFLSRHDNTGRMLSGKIAVFDVRLETEQQAKDSQYSKDVFVLGTARVQRPLGDLRRVEELVLEIDGPKNLFPDGPRQSTSATNGRTLLQLGKRFGKSSPVAKDEIAENLKETSAHDLSHPKVKALAAKAVGDAQTDEQKVKAICRFVSDYIIPTYGNTMPTILDLIDNRQGDCKSYALLFTTLARANGIPAREVGGLLYMGDDSKGFGGHAWNEVVLGGVWVPVDASLNEPEVNATHLSFGDQKAAARGMLESLGKLKLRVVEVKTR